MITLWKTLLIDDEPLARERLKGLLYGFPKHFLIIGEAENSDDAQRMIESLKPDIVFLDIQMPGKNVFSMLAELHHCPFIVFCTAFDHYALQAFQSNSVDYLLKPIDEDRLKKTIEKLEKIEVFNSAKSYQSLVEAIQRIEPKQVPTSIPYKVGDRTIFIRLDQVVYFEADNKYVNFFDDIGKCYLSDQSLKNLEERLPENFVRVSKSIILNKIFIKETRKYFRGRVIFIMNDQKQSKITSGNGYSDAMKRILNF